MASRSTHISDYAAALADGTIPGAFNADRTAFDFPAVESVNSRGALLTWAIRVELRAGPGADSRALAFAPAALAPGAGAAGGGALPPGAVGVITTKSFQTSAAGVRGKARAGGKPTLVRAGKNRGRANETNVATQALRDALGRYNSQKKRAAAREARAPGERRRGPPGGAQPPPMLVKKAGATRAATLTPATFAQGVTVQRKFNGVRVVAYLRGPPGGEEVALYSRTKADYPGFEHLRAQLLRKLARPLPVLAAELDPARCAGDGASDVAAGVDDDDARRSLYAGARVHLDGEIYRHGESLAWISGQARREDDESSLDFYVFDCFFPEAKAGGDDMPSAGRQAYLDRFFAAEGGGRALPNVRRAENFPAHSLAEVEALRDRFLAEGYEGAIARKDCAGYRYSFNNYHSANVVKLKPKLDSEFEVVGYTQGRRGKDVGAVIWICEVDAAHARDPRDKTFNVVPKDMSYEDRYRVFRCLGERVPNAPALVAAGGPAEVTRFERDFRGRPLTVEYPERSAKTGKPVQAKALTFRTYEGGPAADPLRRLRDECGAQ